MRAVFVGASALAVTTARILIQRGHEVVIVERDRDRIEEVSHDLDCGFVHGDGTTPAVLEETNPRKTDFLFCLTDNDQSNIIASLVGRSLGFARQVTQITNQEFEHICLELGLEETIIPSRTIGRFLADKIYGQDLLDLSAMIKHEARVFSFVAHDKDAVAISELALPDRTRVICVYRDNDFLLPDDDTRLKVDDEVVLITHSKQLAELNERWGVPAETAR